MTQVEWGILKKRASNYVSAAEAVLASNDPELFQNALENMHLALELVFKAVIAKNGGTYPDFGKQGHNLEGLIIHKFGNPDNSSILHLLKTANMTSFANISLSVWSMNCRYISMEGFDDIRASINDYKGLYKWINDNLLQ